MEKGEIKTLLSMIEQSSTFKEYDERILVLVKQLPQIAKEQFDGAFENIRHQWWALMLAFEAWTCELVSSCSNDKLAKELDALNTELTWANDDLSVQKREQFFKNVLAQCKKVESLL